MLAIVFSSALIVGCGSSGGPTDPRLVGVWETRKGFNGTLTIQFNDDGTANVASNDGNDTKKYTVNWYVDGESEKGIRVQMQPGGKKEYELRTAKFIDKTSMELKGPGGKSLGRFQRKG